MFVSNSLIADFLTLVLTFVVIIICYWKWSLQYWRRRNVPYLEPEIPFGNLPDALRGKEHIAISLKKLYDEMKKKNWKYGGFFIFNKPNLFLIDLDLTRNIMTKDFQYFMDRDLYVNENEPLQAHLLNLSGKRWKNMRAKLTPTFTSGKMKMMFHIMHECETDLQKRMHQESVKNEPINIKEVLACFTTNIIGSCAFGLDCKALEEDDSPFRRMGRIMFTPNKFRNLKRNFGVNFPRLAKFLNVSLGRGEVDVFMMKMVQDTIEHREKNNYTRNDFMQSLINLKNKPTTSEEHDGKPLTMDEVASQCIVFFAAGFETSSTLMTFTLYQLAKNQDIQSKLRNHINAILAKHDNQVTYDSIQDMTYLNQVIDETLRVHPPAAINNRKCVKDYKVPGEDVIIEKGTTVMMSILGLHYDEELYPNPEKFDPERFSDENRKLRHHYAFLPFGEGPRNCIGMRFGLLQAKVGLTSLLRNYKFTVNQKTQEPLVYVPGNIVLSVKGEVWLNAQKI